MSTLLQCVVATAVFLAATAAGCVLSRRIGQAAAVAARLAGEISEKAAHYYVNLCTALPAFVSACAVSLVRHASDGDPISEFLPLLLVLTFMLLTVRQYTTFPAIRETYYHQQQAPQLAALLALMLWAGASSAWMLRSHTVLVPNVDTAALEQFHPYDYFGPSRIVGIVGLSHEGDEDSRVYTMQLEWPCGNSNSNSAVKCNYELVGATCGYQDGAVISFFCHDWFQAYNFGGLDCSSLASAVASASFINSLTSTSGPYVDILGNCTGSDATASACLAPRLLGSSTSRYLRLLRSYAVQGGIMAGLAVCVSLVSILAQLFLTRKEQKGQVLRGSH